MSTKTRFEHIIQSEEWGESTIYSKGRNGLIITTGIDTLAYVDHVRMYPITSKGNTSESCYLSIPVGAIPDLIQALELVRDKVCCTA